MKSFTPNKEIMKNETPLIIESDYYIDQAIKAWSPILGCEVFLEGEEIENDFNMEETDEVPENYTGSHAKSKIDWVILTDKKGNSKKTFWVDGASFIPDDYVEYEFVGNGGLDIDVEKELSIDENTVILFETSNNGTFTWDIGTIDDWETGKMSMFTAVESCEPVDEDDDGDDIFKPIDQIKFETVRQLFIKAGFKVKLRRYQR